MNNNDFFLVNRLSKNYERGDIVTYYHPENENEIRIHRIVGLPNEKVLIENGKVYIFDEPDSAAIQLEEDYLPEAFTYLPSQFENEWVLHEGQYFLLGDNRSHSNDSRHFGSVSEDLIIGKYWITFGLYPL